ncbi:MAG: hypothetical protein UY16_C0007G0005 [Candidatus Gottesmanbacteria bacterium GW2011_GWA2_47_9]|uniref:SCP domain-containing protein n=1 Tax=Candidatus Gottesmanbacteria bacterium GW2011_GWA2_47_9 TaxID=1618445 RepID=A0A0G1U2Y4_9BACT|nr:MAG: hypothetical protein UY16_C0007G0005 [Candidatus Gottesmanbacteria bacterium GW2011_GWA2_47_9]
MYALGLILLTSVIFVLANVVNPLVNKVEPIPTYPASIALPSPSPTATPTPMPVARVNTANTQQIECVGPDGVHFKTTQQACDDLNNFWKNPNQPRPTVVDDGWERKKVDEHLTELYIPPDDHMSTADELFEAANNYRKAQNLPVYEKNEVLCSIAQSRAIEQEKLGRLDNHEGFKKYYDNQTSFWVIDEVLFDGAGKPLSGVHIIEYGWDRSLTGHREPFQDRTLTHGCGGIAGYFAVFIFGSR